MNLHKSASLILTLVVALPAFADPGQSPTEVEEPEETSIEALDPDLPGPDTADLPDEPEPADTADDTAPEIIEEARPEISHPDPCRVAADPNEPRLDQFRREVFETVCEAAQWFDGFFGNQRFDEEARRTHGRVGALLLYDEHDGVDFDGTLKVRVDFPNLEHRYNAFFGREGQRDYLAGSDRELNFLPAFFEREGDQEWLLGLGYRPAGSDRSSFDFDVGIEAESPIDPYARARYLRLFPLEGDALLRARQTLYWTNQRGVGLATRVDYEKPVWTRTLARYAVSGSYDDVTNGLDWDSGITLYHGFTQNSAVSWYVGVDGETGHDVPIRNYGTRITYRQRMLREWFFGELVTGVTWPRDTPEQIREMAWHVGFGFEIYFSGEDFRRD